MKPAHVLLALGMTLASAPFALALDPTVSSGVAGHGTTIAGPGGRGFTISTSSSGSNSASSVGGRGVSAGMGPGGYNRSTNDGFSGNGNVKGAIAAKANNTMDIVPGRSPTYINVVSGKNYAPGGGGVGP